MSPFHVVVDWTRGGTTFIPPPPPPPNGNFTGTANLAITAAVAAARSGSFTGTANLAVTAAITPTSQVPARINHIQSTFNVGGTSKSLSSTFDVQNGDLIVVIGYTTNATATLATPTWTGTGAVTLRKSIVGVTSPGIRGNQYLWTIAVTAAATARNITVAYTGSSLWGFTATVWRSHGGVGNTASGTDTGTSTALAEYGFNESSGLSTVDMSGNGHTLTASNTVTSWTSSSPHGGAAAGKTEFTGYMGPNITQQNYTIMAWVRREGTWSGYASWFANSNNFMFIEATSADGYLPSFNAGVNSAVGTTAFALNTWTHIAATRASSGASQIYVNGVLEGTATGNTWGQNFGAVAPGGPGLDRPSVCGTVAHTTNNAQWVGSVDDLRVFDRVLTSGEISTYMGTNIVGTTPGGSSGSTPLLNLPVSARSAVEVGVNDVGAVDGTTRTWRTVGSSAMTEQLYFRQFPDYTVYGGYKSDVGAAAGTAATGLTAPTGQIWSAVGVEVLSPSAPPPPSSGTWLSGAASSYAANGSFGTWRNKAVAIGGTWMNDSSLPNLQPGNEWGSWTGPMDIGLSPPVWNGLAAEAAGANDSFWNAAFTTMNTLRSGSGTTYVRPLYEYNGTWMPWTVTTATDIANFKALINRIFGIARTRFPAVKMMLGAAAANGVLVSDTWPTATVDVLSIDFYNNWPFVTDQAGFNDKIENAAGANSLEDLRRLALAKGVPIAVSEWSNQGKVQSAATGGGGESPGFIDAFYAWCAANAGTGAGQLLYEVLFNLWDDQFTFYNGATSTLQPNTANQYKLSTRFGG